MGAERKLQTVERVERGRVLEHEADFISEPERHAAKSPHRRSLQAELVQSLHFQRSPVPLRSALQRQSKPACHPADRCDNAPT